MTRIVKLVPQHPEISRAQYIRQLLDGGKSYQDAIRAYDRYIKTRKGA